MFRQSPRRTHRHRGIKVKHVLQSVLLLGVCTLLVYQMQSSHGESHEDAKISEKLQYASDNFKLGRKDPRPIRTEQVTEDVKQKEEEIGHIDEEDKNIDKGEDHETSEENDPRENLETSLDNESKEDNGDAEEKERMSAGDEETKENKEMNAHETQDYQQNSIGDVKFKDRDGSNQLGGNNKLEDSIIYTVPSPSPSPSPASAPTSAPTSAPASTINWEGVERIKQLVKESTSMIQKDSPTDSPTSPLGVKTNPNDENLDLSPSPSPSPFPSPISSSIYGNMEMLKESLFSGSPSKLESAYQFMKGKVSEISAPTQSTDGKISFFSDSTGNTDNLGSPTSFSQQEKEAALSNMDVFAESPTELNTLLI